MRSRVSFQRIERGFPRDLLIIPGWGFGWEVFRELPFRFNLIVPEAPVCCSVTDDIHHALKNTGKGAVHVLGWSLGGYAALEFAAGYPELVLSLELLSMRRSWPVEDLAGMRQAVEKYGVKALKAFYRLCFSGRKDDFDIFMRLHGDSAMRFWDESSLLRGLEYLAGVKCATVSGFDVPVRLCHGENDQVAPLEEMPFCDRGVTSLVIPQSGHLPFWSEFYTYVFCPLLPCRI